MMPHRIERVNSLIRREISYLLQRQVKDPRIDVSLTVTGVATSPDLKFARVFVSRIGDTAQKQEALDALASAAGYLRKEMARNLKLKSVPLLSFQWDDSIERGDRISRLLDEIAAERNDRETTGGEH